MFSSVLPPMTRIEVTGPLRSLAPIVKMPLVPWPTDTNRCGSWIKLTPAFISWPRPPRPVLVQEKSSRNCHLRCSVPWGASGLVPAVTPLGNRKCGPVSVAGISFTKSENWKTNSLSAEPPATQLWFTLSE